MDKSVGEIAELVGGSVAGDPSVRITGVNAIQYALLGQLTFLGNRQYLRFLESTDASAVLTTEEVASGAKALIHVKNPYLAFVKVIQECDVVPPPRHPRGIHPSAIVGRNVTLGKDAALDAHVYVSDDCVLGDGVVLYAGTYLGPSCRVGDNTVVYPNVTVREGVTIGARCVIHAGAILGSDGFGFAPVNDIWLKIPQVGTVIIEDDVEIGANSAVDRATFGITVVGRGTKIDNLVQIGHNVEIGENCVVSGMTGIAGSTIIGDHTIIAAQVGISDHLVIGDNVTIGARSGVANSLRSGQVVSGYPARDHIEEKRMLACMHRLPDMLRRLRDLERRLRDLEEQRHGKPADDSQ